MAAGAHPIAAWPLLLTLDQLCDYLGGMDERTLAKICPVRPVDLGANLLRYNRQQIDQWAEGLPPRLIRGPSRRQDASAVEAVAPEAVEDRRMSAVDKARARASEGATRWRKTA